MIDKLGAVYLWFTNIFSHLQSIFIFLLRITWGHQFMIAGHSKLWNVEGAIRLFTNLNIPFPTFSVYLVGTCELVFGLFLIIGLFSRLSALITSIIMFVAYSTAHVHVFTFHLIKDPSALVKEAPFPYLMMSLIVLIFGPGKIALDGLIRRWYHRRQTFYH